MQYAIAPKPSAIRVNAAPKIADQVRSLASIEPTDADFISCYLNTSEGRAAVEALVAARVEQLRAEFAGSIRLDFEQAVDVLQSALDALWDEPVPAAVAVFARAMGRHCHLKVIPLAKPVEPSLTFYRLPDLTQLWTDRLSGADYTLVLARRGGIQVLDVQGAETVQRAWASYRIERQTGGASDQADRRRQIVIPKTRLQVLRRVLNSQRDIPIVIAGAGDCLDDLTAALPARAVQRLQDVMRIPAQLDTQASIEFVRRRMEKRMDRQQQRAASRLLRALDNDGLAVSGPAACYEALRTGAANLMVIDRSHPFGAGVRCDECGSVQIGDCRQHSCARCGAPTLRQWHAGIELVYLACRQQVPVVQAGYADLERLGGVGCLLREPIEIEVMPHPASRQPAALDLVA